MTEGIGKYGPNNGFDVVAYKGSLDNPTEIIIVEAKQFVQTKKGTKPGESGYGAPSGVRLNPRNKNTRLPRQMSMEWTFDHVAKKKLVDLGGDKAKLGNTLIDNKNTVGRYVFAIDKRDGSGYFVRLSNDFIE